MNIGKFFILGICLLALQPSIKAFYTLTSSLLRTNQMFNLTISNSCVADYTVTFGDSTPVKSLTNPQKIVSHTYTSAGKYNILITSSNAPSGCISATPQSVEVRDPIQNMTASLNSSLCRPGEYVGILVNVTPVSQVSVYWRVNKTANWIQAPILCSALGQQDIYVMSENGVSVSSNECFEMLTVVDYNITVVPEIGGTNRSVQISRTALSGISDESNYTFGWDLGQGEVINCSNLTMTVYFRTANPDPGYLITLSVYNKQGHSSRLQKYVKIYDPVEKPIQVSYKNVTGTNSPTVFVVSPHKGHGVVYTWDFGDNSTKQNSTNRTMTYTYSSSGDFCAYLTAKNDFSEAIVSLKIKVVTTIEGFGFVKSVTPVETGFPTNIGIKVRNGSDFNVSVHFGDGSEPVCIVNIDEVLNLFVISLWHNYTSSGNYNVTIKAWNLVTSLSSSSIAEVQDPVRNLTVQKKIATECLEVNGTLSVLLAVNGSNPRYYYHFGDGTNVTTNNSVANHSYSTHGNYFLNITAFNDVSSVIRTTNLTVCKPVVPIVTLAVTSYPTNITDPVEFNMTIAEGSDFACYFAYGDGTFDYFSRECYNLTYFADGVSTDKTRFVKLKFNVSHKYNKTGNFEVHVNCTNRLSTANATLRSIVQKPIEELSLSTISPKILKHNFSISWTMANGTNVTFQLDVQGTNTNYSSFKTDEGDSPNVTVRVVGVFVVTLHSKNLVSEAIRSTALIVQDDVTHLESKTWTTTSDWGSNIPGFGPDNNSFPCEYPINFTATPDKGTNLTFWWKFGDGSEDKNTTEPTIKHQYAEGEKEFWANVTVFNRVSKVTKMFHVKVQRSVMNLAITDNSPVKVTLITTFQLSFSKYGYATCVRMNMTDGKGLYVFGGAHCENKFKGHEYVTKIDDNITSITHNYNYTTIDEFFVIVNASNNVSRQSTVFKSVTSALSCFYPIASILNVGHNVSTARKVNRSESVLIETQNEVDCEASKSTSFLWEIFNISDDPVNYRSIVSSVPVKTSDQPYYNLAAKSLGFGFYKLHFTLTMEGVVGISGSADGFIHVVATRGDSLKAVINGGSRKRYKFGTMIPLNATLSVDYDYANISQATPKYYWLCRHKSEPAFNTSGNVTAIPLVSVPEPNTDYSSLTVSKDLGGCFGTGPGRLNISGPFGQIDSRRGMKENSTYVITLVLLTRNPFFKKRDVFNHECVVVTGDPPELDVSCTQTCPEKVNIDQKLALKGTCVVCFGELAFEWKLFRHTVPNINPVDTDSQTEEKNLRQLSTTSVNSLNLVVEARALHRETQYTAVFRAYRQSGQYGEYFHSFFTNSPPENGNCDVTPRTGSAMTTNFTINCTGWQDPDKPLTYEFAYINLQDSIFYVSQKSYVEKIFLPMGREDEDFKLSLRIRIIDGLGAAAETYPTAIKLTAACRLPFAVSDHRALFLSFAYTRQRPAPYDPAKVGFHLQNVCTVVSLVEAPQFDQEKIGDTINDGDGLLKEAIKTGDLEEVVEVVNSVSSILNYMQRQDNLQGEKGNVTEANKEAIKKSENERKEFRREILKDLTKFEITTVNQIKLMASSIDAVTEVPTELDTNAQELAFDSFTQMTALLQSESNNNVGFAAVTEAAASLLSGISNVLLSSSSLAKVDANDTSENITGYSSTGGLHSSKQRARNRTILLFEETEEIGHIILENTVAEDGPLKINTRNFNFTAQKKLLENLGSFKLSNEETKFILPTLDEMGLLYEPNGTQKYAVIDLVLTSFPYNMFTWSNTSKEVKSFSVGLTVKDEKREPLDTSNFTREADIFIPRDASQISQPEEFHVVPLRENEYIQYHTVEVDSANFSIHIQVTPVNGSTEMTVFLLYNERPSPEKFDFNWTIPNFSNCTFRNVSRNVSSLSNSSTGAGANTTNTTETDYQVVIDVVRDCKTDPYTVSISNSMVTKTGTFYIAVYYKKPDPQKEGGGTDSPTNSSTAERERREVPLACGGATGRMKRSCVIIPPPPPKPTTPSKGREGTKPSNEDFRGNTFNPNDTEHYFLRVFSSNCLFWDELSETWINKGCKVGEETKPDVIHCKCNHLTSFGSDFLVAPNPIDFDKVFSADLSKNFVVLLVVCLIFGLYLLLVVLARRFDKKDLEKLGATAVQNRGAASFPYLISIHTGVRQNAGTTSSVYIVLSGDEWESSPMPLVDHDRKVFQRGQENNFVVTLPRSLGNLTHIRIWHDNYGNSASWYLSRISVDDLRTEERWYFICERWLAVEEDDGRVDRVLPVASDKELTHFQHLFVSKTVRELGDGHLWFSVVTRPPTSPFTRVQRVSCCLSLLCLTMVTNCMFYQVGDAEASMMITVGSFEFDLRGFIIGIEASLIVFPVNLALVQIFRNVRRKKPKQQPVAESAEVAEGFADISTCSSTESLRNASSKENMIQTEVEKDVSNNQNDNNKKKKKEGLPHCFVYLAWVLCFLSSVTGAAFTVFYSLAWGPEIANKWLIAFVTSFFQSILILQPVKVVFAALLFAMIIKKPLDSNEDPSEKKEMKESAEGKETGDDILLDYEDDNERYRPPDDDFLKSAREYRLKEVRMSEILKEIFTYFMFLLLLLIVAYGNRDSKAYLMSKNLRDIFVDVDQTGVDLADSSDVDLFFHWARETLVPNLYPGVLYNNKTDKYSGFIDDRYNYLVGISRFRQARVQKESCTVPDEFRGHFSDCMAEYSVLNEDEGDYDVGWTNLNKTTKSNSRRRRSVEEQFAFRKGNNDKNLLEFGDASRVRFRRAIEPVYTSTSGRQTRKKKRPGNTAKAYYVLESAILPDGSIISCPTRWLYQDSLELRGYPFWGHMTLYSGGGYSADLGYDYQTALTVIADLHSHNWVDPQTRSVFIEFTVYNANVNLFGIAFLFLEFLPTGGAFPNVHFVVSRLYSYVGPFSNFVLACQIFLVLFMFYFMYRESKSIYKQRKAYFHGFFNWMEVILIICEFAMGLLYLARWWEVDKNFMKLRYNPKDFVSFQYAGAADESLSLIMGLLVFLVTLRLLKLFRFNKRMSLLGSTLKECAKPLLTFLVSFMLVFLAYAILAFSVFSVNNDKFKNFLATFETQTSIILGDFDYREIEETDRLLGPIYFFTFMYFSVFYLLNMFMAIINDSFTDVKTSNDKQQNEYEMVEFILSRFKESLGLNRNRIATSKSPFGNKSSGFPSSPPFLPSDYKFRDDEDSLSGSSRLAIGSRMLSGKNVLRALTELSKNLDRLASFMENSSNDEAKDEQRLLDMINDMKKKEQHHPLAVVS